MAAAPYWGEVAKGALAIAQAAAIAIAAAWAYFKFVRGRTFAERLEVSVEATPFEQEGVRALRVRTCATNTGASIVKLKDGLKVAYVYGTTVTRTTPGELPEWGKHLVIAPLFEEHQWIEAQETVSDEILVTVPDQDWLAYRVVAIVASNKQKRWSAVVIVSGATSRGME